MKLLKMLPNSKKLQYLKCETKNYKFLKTFSENPKITTKEVYRRALYSTT